MEKTGDLQMEDNDPLYNSMAMQKRYIINFSNSLVMQVKPLAVILWIFR